MVKRSVCICDGKYIGIESIFTITADGNQINIPEKLAALRHKSRHKELFCPCGCGANLVLVASDKKLREQHFRIAPGESVRNCSVVLEGEQSVHSKIVLKCWLDDKLKSNDIETRVPINCIDSTDRKYEFSFLSLKKCLAVSYSYARSDISDQKLDILQSNDLTVQLIHIVDVSSGGCNGQYPEALMKIQDRQGFCLLLDVKEASYTDAKMYAVFYAQDNDGLWKEIKITDGLLSDFAIAENGSLQYKNEEVASMLAAESESFKNALQEELAWREEEKKRQEEAEEERKKCQEQTRILKEKEEAERRAEIKRQEDDLIKDMADKFTQQDTQIKDAKGNRLIKCTSCGLIAKTSEFALYGGIDNVNGGICKSCSSKPQQKQISMSIAPKTESKPIKIKYDASVCPECGGKLCKKNGPYGSFMGCSNYPKCRYTQNIRKGH